MLKVDHHPYLQKLNFTEEDYIRDPTVEDMKRDYMIYFPL